MTQLLTENGLVVLRAYVKTNNERRMNIFYVRNTLANEIDIEYFCNSLKGETNSTVTFQVISETDGRNTTTSSEESHQTFESWIRYIIKFIYHIFMR
jgi:antirestriction protein